MAGAIFIALGFIGFVFRQNKNVVEPDHGATEMKDNGKYSEGLALIDNEHPALKNAIPSLSPELHALLRPQAHRVNTLI